MISPKSLPLLLVLLQLASVGNISLAYNYDRLSEIEKQCSPYLSSALELSLNAVQEDNLKDELSFYNGDWEQEPGGASPLMSFDDSDMFWDWFSYADPLRSVSLEITKQDASLAPGMHNVYVLVSGVLSIGIHRKGPLGFENMGFSKRPGYSSLVMELEGLYIETKEKGAERLLCLQGNTRNSPNSHIAIFGNQPESEPCDLVHVLLRYPRMFNITSQAITGEILSLGPHDAENYFDPVRVTSQLSHLLRYQFNGILDWRDLRYQDHSVERDSMDLLDSRKFCRNLLNTPLIRFSFEEDYYKVDGKNGNRKIGPFFLGKEDKSKQSWQHEGFNIILKSINCNNEFGKVAVVLRVIPESMDQETAVSRTGISGATMIAEGMWDPLSRQLSMVGCAGGNHPDLESRCNSRILLHFPETLSLAQRSVITGNISRNRIDDMEDSFSPLRFSLIVGPEELVNYYWCPTPCDYNYSVTKLAHEFWERKRSSLQFSFISSVMNKAFLSYPSFKSQALQGGKLFARLSHLSKELNFHTQCFPIEFRKYQRKTMYFLHAEMLSLGPLCSHYNPQQYDYIMADDKASVQAKQDSGGSSWVVNASVHLTFTVDEDVFTGRMEKPVTYLFLEGVYDASIGEMSLVGCGDVDVGRSFYVTGPYVDCLMAVRIRYSAVNIRWLKNPTLDIKIMSQRNETDPLYFQPFTLQKISVYSPTHQRDVVFRVIVEGSVRILLLLLDIGIIYSQLLHMKKHPEVVPRISLVMLGIQILGYLLPLIEGSKVLINPKESNSYSHNRPYGNLSQDWPPVRILNLSAKCLLLVVFLLFLRLIWEVVRSRRGSGLHKPTKAKIAIPEEGIVLLLILGIHVLGFGLLFGTPEYRPEDGIYILSFWKKAASYFGIVHTFFMLPQILMNSLWNYSGCRPVRKIYLIGFIMSRWILILYRTVRDPILDPNSKYDWGFGPDPIEVSPSGELSFCVYILTVAAAPFVFGSLVKLRKSVCTRVFVFLRSHP